MDNDDEMNCTDYAATAAAMIRSVVEQLSEEELPRFAAELNHYCEKHGIRVRTGFGDFCESSGPDYIKVRLKYLK